LAVNRPFSNQQGEREADFIQCVVWRKPAENAANFLKKGSLAGVDGRLQTRSYENSQGQRVYVVEVMCESVQFLEPKGSNNRSQNMGQQQQQYQQQPNFNDDPFANEGNPIDISDDDLPF
jgi:single-strand DNA-binding protein